MPCRDLMHSSGQSHLQQSHLSQSAMPPPSFDGQCPSCLKHFSSESSVLCHMNNLRTSCMSWFDFLESVSPPVSRTPSVHHREAESFLKLLTTVKLLTIQAQNNFKISIPMCLSFLDLAQDWLIFSTLIRMLRRGGKTYIIHSPTRQSGALLCGYCVQDF